MPTGSSPTQPGSRVGALKYQTAHGFRRGQPVYGASTGFFRLATTATGFDGVVGSINSANQFELITGGSIDNIASVLVQGPSLYLSSTPGVYATTGEVLVLKALSADKAGVQAPAPPSAGSSTTGTTTATGFTSASNTGSGAPIFNATTSSATALKFKTVTTSGIATITDNGSSLDLFVPAPSSSTLPSYKATILSEPGLVSYWTFDEAPGSTSFADSVGGNTLSAGSPSTSGGMSALLSCAGSSLIVANNYTQGDNIGLPLGNAARSVEFWFRTPTTTAATLFHYGTPSFLSTDFTIAVNNTGGCISVIIGTYPAMTAPSTFITDSMWHHVVVTYDGPATGTMAIWVNGLKLYSQSALILGTTYNSSYPLSFGGSNASVAASIYGMMDEVALYNVALTPTQIARHYYLGRASPTP